MPRCRMDNRNPICLPVCRRQSVSRGGWTMGGLSVVAVSFTGLGQWVDRYGPCLQSRAGELSRVFLSPAVAN